MGDRDRSPRRGSGKMPRGPQGPADRRVFVSNLPFDLKWQEVKDLFKSEVGDVMYVRLYNDETGKARGAGVLEFASAAIAKKAIEKMHRHDVKGRQIVVKEDFDAERDQFGRVVKGFRGGRGELGHAPPMGGMGDMGRGGMGRGDMGRNMMGPGPMADHGDTYGLAPSFLHNLGIEGEIHTKIFISNLDYKVDGKKLKEIFRYAGKVISAEVSFDKEGKSRGFGTVVYDHPVESVQAISMFNNIPLYERQMRIRIDNKKDMGDDWIPNMNRLPEGLGGIGMGLGTSGQPLLNVRQNLPNKGESGVEEVVAPMGGNMGNGGMGNGSMGGMGGGNTGGGGDNNSLQTALQVIAGLMSNNQQTGGMGAGGMGAGMGANMRGSSMGGGSSGGMDGGRQQSVSNSSDTVMVKNLPYDCNWMLLRERFGQAGRVTYTEKTGQGVGLIKFSSEMEAERGVKLLDGMMFDGRNMKVSLY